MMLLTAQIDVCLTNRVFLGSIEKGSIPYPCSVVQRLMDDNSLQDFKTIKDYNLYWPQTQDPRCPLKRVDVTLKHQQPPKKKIK